MEINARLSRGVLPALQALAVEAVVAQRGEDPVHRLIHPLQAHGALGQLCQVHHGQAGPLQAPSREKLLSTFSAPALKSNFSSLLAPRQGNTVRLHTGWEFITKGSQTFKGSQPGLSEGAAPATSPTVLCEFPKLQPKAGLGHKIHGVTT